ncbi:BamA/TamA family outer membrane protein [uncultured Desulfosarcina sp.]|uniref:BamA/TamA family outer membrane protein n=1 Tax=uncultured Desulfosarcina sp. TaxID=218289 RepID=UPI0029C7E16D|nr:BamA/TamA family outer membrane protein [uncultured Desulfosarcina sp.]
MRRGILFFFFICFLLSFAADANAAEEKNKDDRGKNFAVAPIVISNPNIGSGLGVAGMYFFDLGDWRKEDPRSSVQAIGAYTNTDSYFYGLLSSLYLNHDTIRGNFGIFRANINNEYDIPWGGEANFSTGALAALGLLTYRVWDNVFIGGQALVIDVSYDPDTPADGDYLNLVGAEDSTTTGIGPVISYDTRDNVNYPSAGTLAELKGYYKPEAWGNETDYAVADLAVNHYIGLTETHILALRAYGRTGTEDTPYSDKSRLGQQSDLRGFKSGEVSGRTILSGQAEIRWQFTGKIGFVAFGGLAKLWDDELEELITEDLYYSGGVGFRYMLNTDQKINFRIDAAIGNDNNEGIYVGIQEAF